MLAFNLIYFFIMSMNTSIIRPHALDDLRRDIHRPEITFLFL